MDSGHLTILLVWAVSIAFIWMLISSAVSHGTRDIRNNRDKR